MTRLILVRHGESCANRQKIFAGNYNVDLEERGVLQAEKTAEYIKDNFKVDKLYASDLIRAYRTGECIGKALGLEVIPCKGIREICAGLWDGMLFEEIEEKYAESYAVWRNDVGKAQPPEGESIVEMKSRVMTAFTKIAEENDGKTVVCATHATPIRIMQSVVQTGGIENMKDIPWVSNASVSIFEYDNGKWTATMISEDSHLTGLQTHLPANV